MLKGLTLQNVTITKGDHTLISIDTHINAGEVLSVMGPSGSGKSTLLSLITGTLPPIFQSQGRVFLEGIDITRKKPHERHVGILFQDDLLFPHLSVGENLAFGLKSGGRSHERRVKICEALTDIGLKGYEHRDPATLSGGQKSRVSLMRMLLSEPKALLLDEPFSRLDTDLRTSIRHMVFEKAKEKQLPILMVTHDEQDVLATQGQVFHLEA